MLLPIASGRLVNKLLSNFVPTPDTKLTGVRAFAIEFEYPPMTFFPISMAQRHLRRCAPIKAIRAYYNDGVLPQNEFMCEAEEQPFSNRSLLTAGLNEEDRRLLEAAGEISEALIERRLKSWLN